MNFEISEGDWFGGKGVGYVRLLIGEQFVNIYIAHVKSFEIH